MDLIACRGCASLVRDTPGKPHDYIGASAGCWQAWSDYHGLVRGLVKECLG